MRKVAVAEAFWQIFGSGHILIPNQSLDRYSTTRI